MIKLPCIIVIIFLSAPLFAADYDNDTIYGWVFLGQPDGYVGPPCPVEGIEVVIKAPSCLIPITVARLITDENGFYRADDLKRGKWHNVTPTSDNSTFTPESMPVKIPE